MNNKKTKAGFILGIVSLFINPFALCGIIGLIFSILGGKEEKAEAGKMSGYALAGIIMSAISLVFAILNYTVVYPAIYTWIQGIGMM